MKTILFLTALLALSATTAGAQTRKNPLDDLKDPVRCVTFCTPQGICTTTCN